jgi:hypothetical protein
MLVNTLVGPVCFFPPAPEPGRLGHGLASILVALLEAGNPCQGIGDHSMDGL